MKVKFTLAELELLNYMAQGQNPSLVERADLLEKLQDDLPLMIQARRERKAAKAAAKAGA